MPKVTWNLSAKGALVYSFLQGKISCWQKHFCGATTDLSND